VKFAFEVVTACVMVALATWQWRQVARHRNDIALRILAVAVTTLAFVLTMGIDLFPFTVVSDALSVISFSNIAWLFMFYCYAVFFLLAGAGAPGRTLAQRKRQALIEFGVYCLCLVAALIALKTGDPGFWGKYRDPESYRTIRNWVYVGGASVYPLVIWSIGTVRALRYLRMLNHYWARVAIIGVILGTGGMVMGVNGVSLIRQTLYVVYPGSRWPELQTWYNAGRMGGQILLAFALGAAPIAAFVARLRDLADSRRRARYRKQLEPLWRTLMVEFPHLTLPTSGFTATSGHPDSTPAFERMTIEISDGLSHLAQYQQRPYPVNQLRDVETAADAVLAALEMRERQRGVRWAEEPESLVDPPYSQLEPDFGSRWRERVQWMIELQRELERKREEAGRSSGDESHSVAG
jgi:hypothetical protein